jgi:hypothetical protein
MDKLSKFEIQVVDGKIVSGNPVDGTYLLVAEESTNKVDENLFVKIEPSKFSLDDEFMKHRPRTLKERCFKNLLTDAINHKVEDFYCPKFDPSLTEDGRSFCYHPGKMPAVGKPYTWWEAEARRFKHYRESRLGTKYEYALFLATLMKKMLEEAEDKSTCFKDVAAIWDAVCNNSISLGNYRFKKYLWSVGDWYSHMNETGLASVCGFYDLANTRKFLSDDPDDSSCYHWLVGGYYNNHSMDLPLASMAPKTDRYFNFRFGVGWIVLPLK